VLLGFFGAGGVISGLLMPQVRRHLSRDQTLSVAVVIYAAATAILGRVNVASAAYAAICLGGLAWLEIIWRAGLDVRPIDITDPDQTAWLEALVWPDEGNRLQLLREALKVVHHHPVQVVQGDLRTDLPKLVARMPQDATRVVFHSAVLGYLSSAYERLAFAKTVRDLDVVWISNEPPLFPDMTQGLNKPSSRHIFLLSMNQRPVAWTDSHGASLDWIADP
jgi:hypothetical protein